MKCGVLPSSYGKIIFLPKWAGAPVKQGVQLVALGQLVGSRDGAPQGNLHPGASRRMLFLEVCSAGYDRITVDVEKMDMCIYIYIYIIIYIYIYTILVLNIYIKSI